MTKLFNLRLLACVCFILTVGLITACDKDDDDPNAGRVQLLSFGPTGAMHGDTLRVVGSNLNKVTAVALTGATVEQAAFIQHTAELITFEVPDEAGQGFVTLKTADGDIVSKTKLNLEVPVTISSLTPEARPGTDITITGKFMNWVTKVTFANDKAVETFVSQSLEQLVVTVPEDAQSGPLVLSFGGTEPMDVQSDDTLQVTLPVAVALAPNPVKHQTNLTITGTDLDLTKKVLFAGVATPVTEFESLTATQLVVKVPAGTQKGKITLEAASGVQTSSSADLDVVLPAVTTLAPNPVDPGTNLTINGTNLDLVTSVTFSNAPAVASFVSKTATRIVVKVPNGVLRGKITLGVLNSTLTVQSPDVLEITGDVPPPTMKFPIYNDAVTANWTGNSGWIGGGWGGTSNRDNAAPVREGTKSVKIDYSGGWGSPFQLGGANIGLSPYRTFKISVYGAAGSAGKKINIGVNGADAYTIDLVEGKWTDYSIPLSSLGSPATLKEIWVKEYSGSGGFSVYVDALGLD